eukprot:6041345-Pyramimonas_sp.AAC.1
MPGRSGSAKPRPSPTNNTLDHQRARLGAAPGERHDSPSIRRACWLQTATEGDLTLSGCGSGVNPDLSPGAYDRERERTKKVGPGARHQIS